MHLRRNRLQVRVVVVSNTYPMFIEPTITQVRSLRDTLDTYGSIQKLCKKILNMNLKYFFYSTKEHSYEPIGEGSSKKDSVDNIPECRVHEETPPLCPPLHPRGQSSSKEFHKDMLLPPSNTGDDKDNISSQYNVIDDSADSQSHGAEGFAGLNLGSFRTILDDAFRPKLNLDDVEWTGSSAMDDVKSVVKSLLDLISLNFKKFLEYSCSLLILNVKH